MTQTPTQIPENPPAALTPEQTNALLLEQLRVARETLDGGNWGKPRTDRWVRQVARVPDESIARVAVEFGYSYRRFEIRLLWAEGGEGSRACWTRLEPIVFNADTYEPYGGGVNPFLFLVDRFVGSVMGAPVNTEDSDVEPWS